MHWLGEWCGNKLVLEKEWGKFRTLPSPIGRYRILPPLINIKQVCGRGYWEKWRETILLPVENPWEIAGYIFTTKCIYSHRDIKNFIFFEDFSLKWQHDKTQIFLGCLLELPVWMSHARGKESVINNGRCEFTITTKFVILPIFHFSKRLCPFYGCDMHTRLKRNKS